jgi:hypothetical protein
MTWFGICVTYIRFRAGFVKQGIDRAALPYASKLQPFAAYYGAAGCLIICLVSFARRLCTRILQPSAVLRMVCLSSRSMVDGPICDDLLAFGTVPGSVCGCQAAHEGATGQSERYGLQKWSR